MGAVLICNIDGSSCSQFLGGESTIASAKSLKLQPGDKFGTSITVTDSSIFVSTASKTGGSGEVYKFDLSGKSGKVIDIADLFQEKQYFGKSLFASSKSLFIGAPQRKNDAATASGALVKCDLDGTNCADFLSGSHTSPSTIVLAQSGAISGFGASVFANDKNLFVGSQGGIGKVFKCDADGGNCLPLDTSKLGLITNDNLGSTAIVGNDKNLFIAAVGRDQNKDVSSTYDIGAIFQCAIDGTSCTEFLGGKSTSATSVSLKLAQNDKFGSSLALSKDGQTLYIGSIGRKDLTGKAFGSVFKCAVDSSSCTEIVGGQVAEQVAPAASTAESATPATTTPAAPTPVVASVDSSATSLKLETSSTDSSFFGAGFDNVSGPLVGASVAVVTLPIQAQVAAPAVPTAPAAAK
ncbi:MAG: hypothetical protein K2X69_08660 [Silvanigrellaceae bacterium]|nr:hypothetical protein [Silvanigrellaceae bacterium]